MLKYILRFQNGTLNKGGNRYASSAFAKLSATIQVRSTPTGRVEVKGFRKENNPKNDKENECKENK